MRWREAKVATQRKSGSYSAAALRQRFASLLSSYSVLAQRLPAAGLNADQTRSLLERFVGLRDRADEAERTTAAEDHKRLTALLAGYENAVEHYRVEQEDRADDFNLLAVMRLAGKEIRHSMVLAWLLDHDFRKLGTHAQGNLGFKLFLSEFGLPSEYASCKYSVRRELAGDESIVDIEVACRKHFIIHIENKIWASEGTDQTDREWADLGRRALALNVDKSKVHAFFLTPHGAQATNRNFRSIRWTKVVNVLNAFAEQAKPPDVRLFARHYAQALLRFIVTQDTEVSDAETTAQ